MTQTDSGVIGLSGLNDPSGIKCIKSIERHGESHLLSANELDTKNADKYLLLGQAANSWKITLLG